MNVNITLVFQIFNFFIAYLILERFFFRQAFGVVQRRDRALDALKESLASQKRNVEDVRVHVDEQWQQYQRALRSEIPEKKPIRIGTPPVADEGVSERDERKERDLARMLERTILSYFISPDDYVLGRNDSKKMP